MVWSEISIILSIIVLEKVKLIISRKIVNIINDETKKKDEK